VLKSTRLATLGTIVAFLIAPAIAQEEAIESPLSASQLKGLVEDIALPSRAALILPISALENPEIAESVSSVVVDPETGVAIDGYDPVGYFKSAKAIRGSDEFVANHNGAIYHFASAENRNLFLADPERFVPAHGGYCTQTLVSGSLTPGNPNHWTIHGNKLYLTRSAASTTEFRREASLSASAAQRNWEQTPFANGDKYNFRAHQ